MCSIENMAIGIWEQLIIQLPEGVKLYRIVLHETPSIYVEYYGNTRPL